MLEQDKSKLFCACMHLPWATRMLLFLSSLSFYTHLVRNRTGDDVSGYNTHASLLLVTCGYFTKKCFLKFYHKTMETCSLPNRRCYEAIDEVARNEGFIDYHLEIRSGSSKGDNYMGEMRRVEVRAKKSNKIFNLIIKSAPILDAVRNKIPVEVIYNREIVAYTEVLKVLEDVQCHADVNPSVKFNFVRCYYASQEPMMELLILEDLKPQGFKMIEKPGIVQVEHAKLVITALAKLHGLSFVLKKRNPEDFRKISNICVPDVAIVFEDFAIFLQKSLDLAAKVVEDPLHKCKILQVRENYLEHWKECLGGRTYSVICHGDCWINNIMFKDQEGNPLDA